MPLVDTLTVTPQDPRRAKLEGGKRFVLVSEFEPAGDQPTAIAELVGGHRGGRAQPGAARRHRHRQDLHRRQDHRGDPAPGDHPRPEQDAGRAALRRVQGASSPRTRSSISSPTTTTTSRRPTFPRTRHLHREGMPDQRADRPDAPLGDPGAPRTRRRHHRRLGLLHLRHRLGRDLRRDDPGPRRRPRATRSAR